MLGFFILPESHLYFNYESCHDCKAVLLIASPLPSSLLNTGLSNPANL